MGWNLVEIFKNKELKFFTWNFYFHRISKNNEKFIIYSSLKFVCFPPSHSISQKKLKHFMCEPTHSSAAMLWLAQYMYSNCLWNNAFRVLCGKENNLNLHSRCIQKHDITTTTTRENLAILKWKEKKVRRILQKIKCLHLILIEFYYFCCCHRFHHNNQQANIT